MKVFAVVSFVAAFLLVAASARNARFYERALRLLKSSEEKNSYVDGLMLNALENALAENTRTCKTCWRFFGVISKHMHKTSRILPSDDVVRVLCQAMRIYDIDGDCTTFLKATYTNLTMYMSDLMDPSRICPTALQCKPTEQDKDMAALDSFHEDGFGRCTVCKLWSKIIVKVIEEYAKEGQDKLRNELLEYCGRAKVPALRTMCKKGVGILMDHIPEILKGGAEEVCKLLGACK